MLQQQQAQQQQQHHQQDAASEREMSELYALVLDLTHPDNREAALLELSRNARRCRTLRRFFGTRSARLR
jgi:CCR4-NOT transcription complex subunit 9